jgi:delta1-piperideine-2-carboxylate reductase
MQYRIGYEALVHLLAEILHREGASASVARQIAENCVACERDGSRSHGVFRIPGYVSSIRSGWVDATAVPAVEDVGPAFMRVDARRGFAQPALAAARNLFVAKARTNGAAVLAIRNSHHFSALWPDIEPFAAEGFVALSVVNSFSVTVAHGGIKPVFGTNPIAFAAPVEGREPIVFDFATSALAHGDLQIAAQQGRELPPGSGVNRHGHPTVDPEAVLDGGALLTFGGHKGSAISLMIEILSAALTGGHFSFEVDWSAYPGAQTPWTGQFVLLVDPACGATVPFARRTAELVHRLASSGALRLPGDRRHRNRREAELQGIALSSDGLNTLRQLAGTDITMHGWPDSGIGAGITHWSST